MLVFSPTFHVGFLPSPQIPQRNKRTSLILSRQSRLKSSHAQFRAGAFGLLAEDTINPILFGLRKLCHCTFYLILYSLRVSALPHPKPSESPPVVPCAVPRRRLPVEEPCARTSSIRRAIWRRLHGIVRHSLIFFLTSLLVLQFPFLQVRCN